MIGPSASAAPVYAVGGSAYVPPVASALVTPLRASRIARRRHDDQLRAGCGTDRPAARRARTAAAPHSDVRDLLRHAGLDRSGRAHADGDRREPQRRHPEPVGRAGAPNGSGGTIKANGWSVRYSGTSASRPRACTSSPSATAAPRSSIVDGVLKAQTLDGQFGYATQVASAHRRPAWPCGVDYTPRQAAPGIIGRHRAR